ncbi:MAG: ATP synthase F0 subunit B [Deltaproteobacteria bacterium]|nr:ATP synthase F0 subunit B [Deltaproteobacteria bacterium]MBW2128001.1 ATP synthase F0 subunit B [Deltaproteobacteria bacterium]MBW2302580.1 ATP synthase F0 subunit B [Deltaproteobacteria bacterium]
MKPISRKYILALIFLVGVVLYSLFVPDAYAAEGRSTARKIYDNVMLFVNFGILVFLFLKYGKTPLINYLRGVRDKIAEEFESIQRQKEQIQALRDAEAEKMKEVDKYLEEIQNNILKMAEREKERIIKEGRELAEKMIEEAHNYAKNKIENARKSLSNELVDIAINLVEEKLTKSITEKDNENLFNQFILDLQATPGQLK